MQLTLAMKSQAKFVSSRRSSGWTPGGAAATAPGCRPQDKPCRHGYLRTKPLLMLLCKHYVGPALWSVDSGGAVATVLSCFQR